VMYVCVCMYSHPPKSPVAVPGAGVSRMCSGRGSFHRKIQVKSSYRRTTITMYRTVLLSCKAYEVARFDFRSPTPRRARDLFGLRARVNLFRRAPRATGPRRANTNDPRLPQLPELTHVIKWRQNVSWRIRSCSHLRPAGLHAHTAASGHRLVTSASTITSAFEPACPLSSALPKIPVPHFPSRLGCIRRITDASPHART
jgi:hypothetical protein